MRRWGILIALVMRVVLLFAVMQLLETFSKPLFEIHLDGFVEGARKRAQAGPQDASAMPVSQ